MVIGIGTATNVATVLIGGGLGLMLGSRFSARARQIVTIALGLVTLLIAADAAAAVSDRALSAAVGDTAPMLIVLGALLIGGLAGTWWRVHDRIEQVGGWLQSRLAGTVDTRRSQFVDGFVVSSLVFCVGPLTIVGSLHEGLGQGSNELFLKSALDGFAAMAFASSMGVGVLASALSIAVIQGSLTGLGFLLGGVLPMAHLAAVTAVGGLILVGVALQLLELKSFAIADLLPAIFVAGVLTELTVVVQSNI